MRKIAGDIILLRNDQKFSQTQVTGLMMTSKLDKQKQQKKPHQHEFHFTLKVCDSAQNETY